MSTPSFAPASNRNVGPAILMALLVLGAVAAGVFLLNPRKTGELTVENVQTFSPRTEFKASESDAPGSHIIGLQGGTEDNLYLVVKVSVKDMLRLPLFLGSASATLQLSDGEIAAQPVAARDVSRLLVIFPALAPEIGNPASDLFHDGDEVAPGSTRTGKVVLLIPGGNAAVWAGRKGGTLSLLLAHQPALTAAIP